MRGALGGPACEYRVRKEAEGSRAGNRQAVEMRLAPLQPTSGVRGTDLFGSRAKPARPSGASGLPLGYFLHDDRHDPGASGVSERVRRPNSLPGTCQQVTLDLAACPMKARLHGLFLQPEALGRLGLVHLLDLPHDEDLAEGIGKVVDRFLDQAPQLVPGGVLFRIGKGAAELHDTALVVIHGDLQRLEPSALPGAG